MTRECVDRFTFLSMAQVEQASLTLTLILPYIQKIIANSSEGRRSNANFHRCFVSYGLILTAGGASRFDYSLQGNGW